MIPPIPNVPCIKLDDGKCEPPGNPGTNVSPPNVQVSSNPIFVPPTPESEVPTQVLDKPFVPRFITLNILVNKCDKEFCYGYMYPSYPPNMPPYEGEVVPPNDPNDPTDPSDPFVPEEVEYEYLIEYCNPYVAGECHEIPFVDEEDFQNWLGGKFYVYLLDVMVNPDYIKYCQAQATKLVDLEPNSSLPFYFGGADLSLEGNKGKKLSNHTPYKAYEIKMKIDKMNYHPYYDMENVRIPDAHQKVSFMVKFIPYKENTSVLEYNICNIDHFAIRPAYFFVKTSDFKDSSNVNNIFVKKDFFENKQRITSSFNSNQDFHTKIFLPSDYKNSSNDKAFGVPNYKIGLGFYESNPPTILGGLNKIKSSKLIKTSESIVVKKANEFKPYIKGISQTCKLKEESICLTGLCGEQKTVVNRSRAIRNLNPAAAANPQQAGQTTIWTKDDMLIEAMFAYFDGENYIGQSEAHNKIKKIREKLVYFTGSAPISQFDQDENNQAYETRSLISTHLFGDQRIFTYNNFGDMQIFMVDDKWTIYDQYPRDDLGRQRNPKCVIGKATNAAYPAKSKLADLNGCNVDIEVQDEVVATYVPEFIELNPILVDDKFHNDGKDFTYFANKVGTKKYG